MVDQVIVKRDHLLEIVGRGDTLVDKKGSRRADRLFFSYVDQALECLTGNFEVFPGGFEFALRLFHAYLGYKTLSPVDHPLLL